MMTPEEQEREFVTFATEQLLEAIAQPIKGAMAEGRENVRRQARREALEEANERLIESLARIYLYDGCSLPVAEVCDSFIDKSGGLLGKVRDKARALMEKQE